MNIIIVVGEYRAIRAFLEERARGAALRGERFSHRISDGTLTIGDHTRYVTANDPRRLMGLAGVIDVVALYGADERAVAEAWLRAARPRPRTEQRSPPPALSIDIDALWSMGIGERTEVLRALGQTLRPFCPAAADELETYEGGNTEPPPTSTFTVAYADVRFDDGTIARKPDGCTCPVDQGGAIHFTASCALHAHWVRGGWR